MYIEPREIITRGIMLDEKKEKILLCSPKSGEYSYLPGGHVEGKEYAEEALLREIREETEINAEIGPFAGILENIFYQNGEKKHETNYFFELRGTFESTASKEDHIFFHWEDLSQLSESNLLPRSLASILITWIQEGRTFFKIHEEYKNAENSE